MSRHPTIPPWMIPTKPTEPAQIPLPAPGLPSIYDRRPPEESDRDRAPHSTDIGNNDGGDGSDRSNAYRF